MPYEFDPLGQNPDNSITIPNQELHVIPQLTPGTNHRVIVPKFTPYILEGGLVPMKVSINNNGTVTQLVRGVDWTPVLIFETATRTSELPVYGAISILRGDLVGTIGLEYQTIGGNWTLTTSAIADLLNSLGGDITRTYWEQVSGYPSQYPPVIHPHEPIDFVGMADLVSAVDGVASAIAARPAGASPADYVAFAANVSNQLSGFIDLLNTAIAGVSLPGLEDAVADNTDAINAVLGRTAQNAVAITRLAGYNGSIVNITSDSVTEYTLDFTIDGQLDIPGVGSTFDVIPAQGLEYHIKGTITSLVIDAGTMNTDDKNTIVYRGDNTAVPLVVSFTDNGGGTKKFYTYNQNTGLLVNDTTLEINIINNHVELIKMSDGNIFVVF